MNARFLYQLVFQDVWSRYYACSFVLCGSSNIFDYNTLTCIRSVVFSVFRILYDPDKLVVDHDPLASVLACSSRFIDRDFIDQFPQHRCSQRFHLHKLSYCPNKLLLVLLHGINRIELLTKFGNPAFQLYSLDLILVEIDA